MNLVRSLSSVGGLTLVSRVLALVRDTLQASYVGAGFASDAFFVAFRLPNMFRALFAEGAFSAAFIPLYAPRVTRNTTRICATRWFRTLSIALSAAISRCTVRASARITR